LGPRVGREPLAYLSPTAVTAQPERRPSGAYALWLKWLLATRCLGASATLTKLTSSKRRCHRIPGAPKPRRRSQNTPMRDAVIAHVRVRFQEHRELAESLPEQAFGQKLSIRSNTVGGQFWCLIGARESYTRAIRQNGWVGFSCSLSAEASKSKQAVLQALGRTTEAFDQVVNGLAWTEARDGLLLGILEHETQHQGQLIRYMYGLDYVFPESWAKRWALTE
jgi:hypothetical protein